MKRLLVVCAFASTLALMLVATSSAAPPMSSAVAVNPNPVLLDAPFVVSGCGYRPAEQLWVSSVVSPGSFTTTDSAGCFSLTWLWQSAWFSPTTQQVEVIVYDAGNGKIKSKGLAAVWFWVMPAV